MDETMDDMLERAKVDAIRIRSAAHDWMASFESRAAPSREVRAFILDLDPVNRRRLIDEAVRNRVRRIASLASPAPDPMDDGGVGAGLQLQAQAFHVPEILRHIESMVSLVLRTKRRAVKARRSRS
jgi:hypothetical protein